MTDEIAPCPFCDGSSVADVIPGRFYVGCHNLDCDAAGPTKDTKAEAIAAWNRLAAALKLAAAARAWLAEVERVDPLPADQCVLGGVTVGMIRATDGSVDKST